MIIYTDAYLPCCGDGQDGNTHNEPPMRKVTVSRFDDEKKVIHAVTHDGITVTIPFTRAYRDGNRSPVRRRDLL